MVDGVIFLSAIPCFQVSLKGSDFLKFSWMVCLSCVSKNGSVYPPKWMVKIMENPIKMEDLGGIYTPILGNTQICVLGKVLKRVLSQSVWVFGRLFFKA